MLAKANPNEPQAAFGITWGHLKLWNQERESTSLRDDANVYEAHARADAVKCV